MRTLRLLVVLIAASACWAQDAATTTARQRPSTDTVPGQTPDAPQSQTITVPEGTRIPMSLASPVTKKAAHSGTPVRAVTGFPVTVGTQLAIPAGTYVEGIIDDANTGSTPGLVMHFTRLLYSNGYSVPLNGATVDAELLAPDTNLAESMPPPQPMGARLVFVAQQIPPQPPLPPLPHSGPNYGPIIGLAVGGVAIAVVSAILLGRHRGSYNGIIFDTGWQFEMALKSPLTVDAASVAAATK